MPRQPAKPYRRPKPEAPDPRFAPLPEAEAEAQADDADAPPVVPSAATGLSVQPQSAAAQSLAARAFRREMARLDRLRTQLAELQRHGRAYRLEAHGILQPLRDEHQACMRELALALDAWLDVPGRGLSRLQQQTARDIVCHFSAELARAGDAGMAALHDRRSPRTLAELRQAEADGLRERVGRLYADWLGTEAPADLDATDPEAAMRAALERLKAQAAEQAQQRQAKAEARQARRKPGAAQLQAQQASQDADGMLRGIYRQLASVLHPDREPDEAERRRKNALMGEANAAYERQDLATLLNLQLQAELVDPDHLERVSEQRLQSLVLLLKRQVAALERERQAEQERWWHELQLPRGAPLTAAALQQRLDDERDALQQRLQGLRRGLDAAAGLATLKPWLNRQRPLDDFPFQL